MAEHYPEANISGLGEIGHVSISMPHYDTCHIPILVTGKIGSAPGELNYPCSVAIHEDTHEIFLANYSNNRVEIFSETGEYLYQLAVGQLFGPHGIAIHGDNVYVSCWDEHTINKFSLTEMCRVRRIESEGSDDYPTQLTTDHIGRVFMADTDNHRICIHDTNLKHLQPPP